VKISYTPESIDDLVRLRAFIEEKNPVAAERIANSLLSGIEKLKVFPRMGLPVGSAPDPEVIRDLYIEQYTVRYISSQSELIVLRIWHNKEHEKDS
jgi:plasmid stabilization system protein ParE